VVVVVGEGLAKSRWGCLGFLAYLAKSSFGRLFRAYAPEKRAQRLHVPNPANHTCLVRFASALSLLRHQVGVPGQRCPHTVACVCHLYRCTEIPVGCGANHLIHGGYYVHCTGGAAEATAPTYRKPHRAVVLRPTIPALRRMIGSITPASVG
jgi:hypothetical protein